MEASQLGFPCTADQISSCDRGTVQKLLHFLACKAFDRTADLSSPTVDALLQQMVLPMQTFKLMSRFPEVGISPKLAVLADPAKEPNHILDLASGYFNYIKYRMAAIEAEARRLKAEREALLKDQADAQREKESAADQLKNVQDTWRMKKPLYDQKEAMTLSLHEEERALSDKAASLQTEEDQLSHEIAELATLTADKEAQLSAERKFKVDIMQADDISRKITAAESQASSSAKDAQSTRTKLFEIKRNIAGIELAIPAIERYLRALEEVTAERAKISRAASAAKEQERKKDESVKEIAAAKERLARLSKDTETAAIQLEKVAGGKLALQGQLAKLRSRQDLQLASVFNAEASLNAQISRGQAELELIRTESGKVGQDITNFQVDLENQRSAHNRVVSAARHKLEAIVKMAQEAAAAASPEPKRFRQ